MTESITHWRRAALGCTLGLAVLLAVAPSVARAQDDEDDSIWNLDKRMFRGLMSGLGLQSPYGSDIEYQERAPLVVPPTKTLPPPQTAAKRPDPAWPADPDLKRRADAANKKKKATNDDPDTWADPVGPGRLGPAGGASSGSTRTSDSTRGDRDYDGNPVKPAELGYSGGLFSMQAFGFGRNKDEVGTFTKEPPRTTLTDPPVGYQTPSGAQPYGVTRRDENTGPRDPQLEGLGND